jgi:hypothetical protein
MLTSQELSALAQSVDSSWGNSSTPQTASYSVKMSIVNENQLSVRYMAVVNFASQNELIRMKRAYGEEAQRVIAAVLKNVKAKYKEIMDKSLKLKEVSEPIDSVEVIGLNVHNPKRTAYYRSMVVYEIG